MQKLVLAALLCLGVAASAADFKKETIYTPAADLKWEQPYGPDGPSVAFPAGDPKKGPVALFMKFPAGYDSGWHTHDSWYVATVVKGTMTSQGQGDAAAKELPVGSFYSEPPKKNHKNTCGKDGECIIFGYQEKGMTFTPKTPEGKDLPKEKKDAAKKEEPKK
jgi:quercetin dioxygenase-like cupin family protein